MKRNWREPGESLYTFKEARTGQIILRHHYIYKLTNSPDFLQRNWVFATNSDFLIPKTLQPNVADLKYFKLWILFDQII